MVVRIFSKWTDEDGDQHIDVEVQKDVLVIQWWNQKDVDNGLWINLIKTNGSEFSIQFDPDKDWFTIYKD